MATNLPKSKRELESEEVRRRKEEYLRRIGEEEAANRELRPLDGVLICALGFISLLATTFFLSSEVESRTLLQAASVAIAMLGVVAVKRDTSL